jgi:multicomponent Na+:H+ antiporter subunit C
MNGPMFFWLTGSMLIGLGLYGVVTSPLPLRKLLALNLLGTGVFVLFGVIARRGAGAGLLGDPVPHALIITGIVVAFSATAIAVALLLRLFAAHGTTSLDAEPSSQEAKN